MLPYPKSLDELANRHIRPPVIPRISPPPISGWDLFWAGAIAAGGAALIAGQAGPQVAAPEEVVTVPVSALVGGFVALWGTQ